MTQTYEDGGGGSTSTTDTGVCSITPSDLVGYTGSALNRIKDLEQRVAELEAKIVQANQLSDLAQQVGWVGGIEYMGVGGWTQTEYGTLIPPEGWTLAGSGIIPNLGPGMQLVYTDAEGNIISASDLVSGGAMDNYAFYQADSQEANQISSGVDFIIVDPPSPASDPSMSVRFQVSEPGLYLVTASGDWNMSSISGGSGGWTGRIDFDAGTTSGGSQLGEMGICSVLGFSADAGVTVVNDNAHGISGSMVFRLSAGNYINVAISAAAHGGASFGATAMSGSNVSVFRMRGN
jgi:hypothetical protein